MTDPNANKEGYMYSGFYGKWIPKDAKIETTKDLIENKKIKISTPYGFYETTVPVYNVKTTISAPEQKLSPEEQYIKDIGSQFVVTKNGEVVDMPEDLSKLGQQEIKNIGSQFTVTKNAMQIQKEEMPSLSAVGEGAYRPSIQSYQFIGADLFGESAPLSAKAKEEMRKEYERLPIEEKIKPHPFQTGLEFLREETISKAGIVKTEYAPITEEERFKESEQAILAGLISTPFYIAEAPMSLLSFGARTLGDPLYPIKYGQQAIKRIQERPQWEIGNLLGGMIGTTVMSAFSKFVTEKVSPKPKQYEVTVGIERTKTKAMEIDKKMTDEVNRFFTEQAQETVSWKIKKENIWSYEAPKVPEVQLFASDRLKFSLSGETLLIEGEKGFIIEPLGKASAGTFGYTQQIFEKIGKAYSTVQDITPDDAFLFRDLPISDALPDPLGFSMSWGKKIGDFLDIGQIEVAYPIKSSPDDWFLSLPKKTSVSNDVKKFFGGYEDFSFMKEIEKTIKEIDIPATTTKVLDKFEEATSTAIDTVGVPLSVRRVVSQEMIFPAIAPAALGRSGGDVLAKFGAATGQVNIQPMIFETKRSQPMDQLMKFAMGDRTKQKPKNIQEDLSEFSKATKIVPDSSIIQSLFSGTDVKQDQAVLDVQIQKQESPLQQALGTGTKETTSTLFKKEVITDYQKSKLLNLFAESISEKKRKKEKIHKIQILKQRRARQAPSLSALVFGIKGKYPKGTLTGLEQRPIPIDPLSKALKPMKSKKKKKKGVDNTWKKIQNMMS